jgi:hypothetical protein
VSLVYSVHLRSVPDSSGTTSAAIHSGPILIFDSLPILPFVSAFWQINLLSDHPTSTGSDRDLDH